MSADPYVYPGTETLINKFNIKDPVKFREIEGALFGYMSLTQPMPEGSFDYDHLKIIHKHFFGESYDWAGQERTVDIIKGNSHFARKEFIGNELNKIFSKLKADNHLQGLEPLPFCKKLSYYFNEINAAHPFREGNGRTLRAFSNLLAKQAGYSLDWCRVSEKDYLHANIVGFNADYEPMTKVFQQILSPSESIRITGDVIHINKALSLELSQFIEIKKHYDEAATRYFSNLGSNNKAKFKQAMDDSSAALKTTLTTLLANPDYLELTKHRKYEPPVSQSKASDAPLSAGIRNKILTTGQVYKVITEVDSNSKLLGLAQSKSASKSHTL